MTKKKLPRGLTYRDSAVIASFALKDGTIARRRVGIVGVTSENECVRRRLQFMKEVDIGTYEAPKPRKEKPKIVTVTRLWDDYLVDYRNRGGRDDDRLGIAWKRLKPHFDKKPVEDVSTGSVNKYIEARRAEGVQNATVNREVATLRAMFRHGTRVTPPTVPHIPAFPARLKEPPARKGFVTDEQYAVLAKNAKDLLWLRALIACAYSFGFRKGELLASLRTRQIDLIGRRIELEEGTTKNGEGRKVHMTSEVFELMVECVRDKKPDDFVFTRACGQVVCDPRKEWYSLCVASGLGSFIPAKRKNGKDYLRYEGLNLHDFRRSAIRNMTRRGVNDTTAMKISGHKTASVFRRYNIVDERDLVEATRLIEAGRQVPVSAEKSDTETSTAGYAHA
jgi:integrase